MKRSSPDFWLVLAILALTGISAEIAAIASDQERKFEPGLAPTPPMGWNSYDAYGNVVTEQQLKAVADYMAEHLSHLLIQSEVSRHK
jgi:mono/diheme cytochrome c family protein